MIFFSQILNLLQGAEFNNLAIVEGKGGAARVKRTEYNRLISVTNAALDVLHQRFELASNTVRIQTTLGKTKYVLDASESIYRNPMGFILDSPDDPFTNDILEISAIHAPNGRELLLNNYHEHIRHDHPVRELNVDELCISLYTLDYRTLRIPPNLRDTQLTITYRCSGKHLDLLADEANDPIDDIYIPLPISYINAIVYYIASRIYNAKGAETIGRGIFHEGNNYQTKFEQEAASLKTAGFEVEQMIDDTSGFYNKGFI